MNLKLVTYYQPVDIKAEEALNVKIHSDFSVENMSSTLVNVDGKSYLAITLLLKQS